MKQINNEAELLATQEQIDAIVDKQNITQFAVLRKQLNVNLEVHTVSSC